ncbi:unnamed protein product [Sphagnum troendelagicum]|uniref:Protein kinase domain-containing protein n=1 Tax=Sphagnum troendelagicum TaxID=128251 RepID=A0ABP0U3G8_9BRYO
MHCCVSDFGLPLLGPEEILHISMAAAGTMGYIDPEYYPLQHLTTKSDISSFGVVLLELRTVGRKPSPKCSNKNNKRIPVNPLINVVDFAAPRVQADGLVSILDIRLPIPQGLELQHVSILASVAEHCVRQEVKERPSMTHIVTRLEQAFSFSCNNRRKSQPAPQESSDQYNNNNNAAANSSIANRIHQEIQELGLKHDDDVLKIATCCW